MKGVLVSTDLMVASHIEDAAARRGATLMVAANLDAAVEAVSRGPVDLVILDLTTSSLDVEDAVRRLREAAEHQVAMAAEIGGGQSNSADSEEITLVAFAPHVHTSKLAAARQAGCNVVVSRGRFYRSVDEFFAGEPDRPPCGTEP